MILKSLLIVYLLASTIYASTHIRWRGGYHDALMEAKKNDKILMVLLIKNDCLECKNIVKNIFTNKPYIDELNKSIVAVIVNIDNKNSYPIEMYWSNEYPTLFFVNSKDEMFINKPLYKTTTRDDIKVILDKALNLGKE
jgi:thioredoxin-related protein